MGVMRPWGLGLVALLLGSLPQAALASGAYLTDDPGTSTSGVVQMESWLRAGPTGWEHWVVPSFLLPGEVEGSIAMGVTSLDYRVLLADYVLQGKRTMWTGEHGAGIGMAVGASLRAGGRPVGGLPGTAYAYFPMAITPGNGPWTGVIQPGVNLDAMGAQWLWQGTYAVQSQHQWDPKWSWTLEANGSFDAPPYVQLGISHWVRPEQERWDLALMRDPQGAWQLCLAWCAYGWQQKGP